MEQFPAGKMVFELDLWRCREKTMEVLEEAP